MKTLFIDCPTGVAGDMLLGSFLDLGVPRDVIEEPLLSMGLGKSFSLVVEEGHSLGLRGLRVCFKVLESDSSTTRLQEIIAIVQGSSWNHSLRDKVLKVFSALAEAEASVHGKSLEDIHFHEIGDLDALLEVVCVCAAVEYLNPLRIFCSRPPAGSGNVNTSHGVLPVPVPVVVELAKRHQIKLVGGGGYPQGELTTPTGLALLALLVDSFCQPPLLDIQDVGIGLGRRIFDRPNLLRVCLLDETETADFSNSNQQFTWQELVLQEAWIDDATPEDIAHLIDELRKAGVIDVVSHPVHMKKGREGVCIKAIVQPGLAESSRSVWFSKGTTIGLREHSDGRWVLSRRRGTCMTPYGNIGVKQVRRPDGRLTVKPEYDELVRISLETGKSLEELRYEVSSRTESFSPNEEWN